MSTLTETEEQEKKILNKVVTPPPGYDPEDDTTGTTDPTDTTKAETTGTTDPTDPVDPVKKAKSFTEIGADIKQAYDDVYGEKGSFYNIVQDKRKQYEDAIEEEKKRRRIDYNTAKWTAVTEAAASLANLIGVGGYGASNQQYHQYSQDWMKKADADSKERRQRIDRLREQQREMESQLEAGRLKGAIAVAQLDQAEREAEVNQGIANTKAAAAVQQEIIRQEGQTTRAREANQTKKEIATGNNATSIQKGREKNAADIKRGREKNESDKSRTESQNASRERVAEKKGKKEVPAEKVIENL